MPNLMKIRTVGAELFHTDRQTDRQTKMTKPIVGFRNFAKAPNNKEAPRFQTFAVFWMLYAFFWVIPRRQIQTPGNYQEEST